MNDIYVFIATQNGLISYPNDQTHNYFQYAISKAKNNAQIVLVRKDNLLHYCYVRKINNKQIFGLCLRLDRIYSDAKDLFRAFDSTVSKLVESGVILQIDDKANIKLCVSNFVSETVAVKEMSDTLIHALGITQKNTVPLPPADYSISINDCIELSLEDSTNVQIINAIKKYSNVYIVKTHDEISRVTEFANLIKKKNGEINQLQDTIIQQDNAISDLKKSKNKYKWVLCLLSFIFIGIIAFYFFAQSKSKIIDDQTDEIENLNSDVQSKNTRIQNLKQNVLSLEKELENANTTIINLMVTNELVTDSLRQTEEKLRDSEILIEEKNNNIADLKTKLPQKYKTKYEEQYLYINCANKFTKGTCYFPDKGTTITVFLKKDGYGLTQIGGWIPMSSLEEY